MKLNSVLLVCISTIFPSSLESDPDCPPSGIEYLPLPDCTIYKLCLNGESSEIACPAGLYYNPNLKNCDLPENVPECIGGKRGILTECGQTMKANSGAIEYKLNQTYDTGELCVFILRHNYSTNPGFRFILESHGISHLDQDSIYILTFRPDRSISTRLASNSKYLGPPNLIPVATFDGYVAVVIFRTYSNTGTGFRLSFKGTGDPEPTPGYNDGMDLIFNDETESPLAISSRPSCTGYGCLDVFAMTSEAKLITDHVSNFRLSLFLDPFPSNGFGCLESIKILEQRRTRSLGGGCWTNNTREMVYDGRGMFLTILVWFPDIPSTGTIKWEKVLIS